MDVHRTTVWQTAGRLVYIPYGLPYGRTCLPYGRFDFFMYVGATPPHVRLFSSKCMRIFMHSPFTTSLQYALLYILGTLLYFIAKYLYSIVSNCSFFDDGENTTINLYSMDLHEDNPVSAETSNVCAQNGCMHTAWYISLHTVCIQSHLCAYSRFVFSRYAGDTRPHSRLFYQQMYANIDALLDD